MLNCEYLNRMVTKTTVSKGKGLEKRIELVLFKFCKNFLKRVYSGAYVVSVIYRQVLSGVWYKVKGLLVYVS